MTLGQITVVNSVKYFSKSEQTRENKQNTIKNESTLGKQKKYFTKQ